MSDRYTPPVPVNVPEIGAGLFQSHRMAHWERCNWVNLDDLRSALDHLAPPTGMTVADLYYQVSAYMERNDWQNHERRYRAWLNRRAAKEPDCFDPYRTQAIRCGDVVTVPPGQGAPNWSYRYRPSAEAIRASETARQLWLKDRPAGEWLQDRIALAAVAKWEKRQRVRPSPAARDAAIVRKFAIEDPAGAAAYLRALADQIEASAA